MKLVLQRVIEILYTVGTTYMTWSWSSWYAYQERGYKAFGGEVFLTLFVLWMTYKIISWYFKCLEDYTWKS